MACRHGARPGAVSASDARPPRGLERRARADALSPAGDRLGTESARPRARARTDRARRQPGHAGPAASTEGTPAARRPSAARAALPAHWREIAFAHYLTVAVALFARTRSASAISRLLRGAIEQRGYLTASRVCRASRRRMISAAKSSCRSILGRWPAERLAMVLAHEQAHARRRDSIVRLLSLINRAVFWFHPWRGGCIARSRRSRRKRVTPRPRAAPTEARSRRLPDLHRPSRARRAGHRVEPAAIAMASMGSTALSRRVRAILMEPPPSPAPPRTAALRNRERAAAPGVPDSHARSDHRHVPGRGRRQDTIHSAASTARSSCCATIAGWSTLRTSTTRNTRIFRFSPCSTFKLPFAVMFLENGIVRDPARRSSKYDPRVAAGAMTGPPGTAHDRAVDIRLSRIREAVLRFRSPARSIAPSSNNSPRDPDTGTPPCATRWSRGATGRRAAFAFPRTSRCDSFSGCTTANWDCRLARPV